MTTNGDKTPSAQTGESSDGDEVNSKMIPNCESVKEKTAVSRKVISNGGPMQVIFKDTRTKLIVKMLFCKLNPVCGRHLHQVERQLILLNNSSDVKLIKRLCYLIIEMLKETNTISINMNGFIQLKWKLSDGNMYSEFIRVAQETFKDAINWGRVLAFLGFCVSFSLYLVERMKVLGSVEGSVMEWTCQVIEEDLGHFYTTHEGWEGFASFLEIALGAAQRKKSSVTETSNGGHDEQHGSVWNGAVAAGAMAIGAMTVLTLRQAFS